MDLIEKALYGYRRSPRRWQQWLAERLLEVGLQRSAVDPALFYNLDQGIAMLVHVDDMMLIGPGLLTETIFKKLQTSMKLREVGRLDKSGDEEKFLNKLIMRTKHGFILRGNTWIVDELVKRADVVGCKYTATPAVKYAVRQVLDFTSHRRSSWTLSQHCWWPHVRWTRSV